MIARAPGKLVLSGAYAVLWGSPAIVTAVDRYVTADSAKAPDFVTPEVRAALGTSTPPPAFDASQLRGNSGKLGLGSSAAILVASLGALAPAPLNENGIRDLLERAVVAHRSAQGGGSGIDVVSSTLGGTLVVRPTNDFPNATSMDLPAALDWSVWFSGHPTATSVMIAQVKQLERAEPSTFERLMAPHRQASEAAATAIATADATSLFAALDVQRHHLGLLGEAAGAPIVTPEVAELHAHGAADGALCMPSGAGGGDVMVRVGRQPANAWFERRAHELGFVRLDLVLGARGLHWPQQLQS